MFAKIIFNQPAFYALRLFAVLACALAFTLTGSYASAQAQPDPIPAKREGSAYQQDSEGIIVRSSDGLCWRSGYWTSPDAVAGCDGSLAPPIGKISAPPVSQDPAPADTSQVEPASIPTRPTTVRCDFTLTLSGDQSFDFNSAILSAEARQQLDEELVARLDQCARPAAIRVTGHTDRLGSPAYNRQLSLQRAQAVAAYVHQRVGQQMNIETAGAGATQASRQCEGQASRQALLACLAPDRRVTIEVHGTQN